MNFNLMTNISLYKNRFISVVNAHQKKIAIIALAAFGILATCWLIYRFGLSNKVVPLEKPKEDDAGIKTQKIAPQDVSQEIGQDHTNQEAGNTIPQIVTKESPTVTLPLLPENVVTNTLVEEKNNQTIPETNLTNPPPVSAFPLLLCKDLKLLPTSKAQGDKDTEIQKITDPDGNIIEGQFQNGKLNGTGSITYSSSKNNIIHSEEGQFVDGSLVEGIRKYIYAEKIEEGKFGKGALTEGSRTQTQTFPQKKKTTESGTFLKGELQGNGKVVETSLLLCDIAGCKEYEGIFEKGQFITGTMKQEIYQDPYNQTQCRMLFQGKFKNLKLNDPSGVQIINYRPFFDDCVAHFPNAVVIEGEFIDGKFCKGIKTYNYDNIIKSAEGDFKNDYFQGQGKVVLFNGDVVEGQFENGHLLIKEDKDSDYLASLEPVFQKRSAELVTKSNYDKKDAEKNQLEIELNGFCKKRYPDGKCESGHFMNNKLHGQGYRIYQGGPLLSGKFSDGKLVDGSVNFFLSPKEEEELQDRIDLVEL